MSEPPGWERGAAASERGHQQASLNAVRLLAPMLSEPANRSCAECRVHLADTSQIYASFGTGEAAGLGPGPGPGPGRGLWAWQRVLGESPAAESSGAHSASGSGSG